MRNLSLSMFRSCWWWLLDPRYWLWELQYCLLLCWLYLWSHPLRFVYIYFVISVVLSVCLSDHNSGTPGPIGLKFWLGNSREPRECSQLCFVILSYRTKILYFNLIYDQAQVYGRSNYQLNAFSGISGYKNQPNQLRLFKPGHKNISVVLVSSQIQIWGKSVDGFMSYDRKSKQTDRLLLNDIILFKIFENKKVRTICFRIRLDPSKRYQHGSCFGKNLLW